MPNRNYQFQIPNWFPLATQQAIVAEIEAEQALVAANRELIARFEKKIRATLARVWGEDQTSIQNSDASEIINKAKTHTDNASLCILTAQD